jgi:hypothetical protein
MSGKYELAIAALLLSVCGGAVGAEPEAGRLWLDQVARAYPDSSPGCTGTLYEYFWVSPPAWHWEKWDGEMFVAAARDTHVRPQWYKEWSGFAKFDLSSIPDSARVVSVSCVGHQSTAEPTFRVAFYLLDCDPETASAERLGSANVTYIGLGATHGYCGLVSQPLPGVAAAMVQDRLGDDWIAISIRQFDGIGTYVGYNSASPPYLAIGYYIRRDQDVTPTGLVSPSGRVSIGATIEPAVALSNCGLMTLTVPVRLNIGSDYADTVSIEVPGSTTAVAFFRNWTATHAGWCVVRCSTMLAGDSNPGNDLLSDSFEVAPGTSLDDGQPATLLSAVTATPNPVHGRWLVLTCPDPGSDPARSIEMLDASGRVALQRSLDATPQERSVRFDIAAIPRGVYLLHVSFRSGKRATTLVVRN